MTASMPSAPHFDRLLLTGAVGVLGRVLRTGLKPHCTTLRLSDINPPGDAAAGEELHPLLLFVLGTLLDMAATILIRTPIFLPIAMQFGMAPVQFGIIMLINCALGLNTPPVGTMQFVGCAIGGISMGQVMRTIAPFYGALALCLALVTYVPAFSLWLPAAFK